MEMKLKKKDLQEKLKTELQKIGQKPVSDGEAWEALFNLSGFFKVLKQMKKEAIQNGTI